MKHTDIAIVGGGLAGSTAAAMLSHAGYSVLLIDPHPIYPPDFRCEKLDQSQIEILKMTGLADSVLKAGTRNRDLWIARFGRLVEKIDGAQCGILYDTLVNTIRSRVPAASLVIGKVTEISTNDEMQTVTISTGDEITARLVILANGLNVGLRHKLGIGREVLSAAHSISIGFDAAHAFGKPFDFSALTYYPEASSDRMAYLSLFPIGETTRANLFVYRDAKDPWLSQFRKSPKHSLLDLVPNLEDLAGPFNINGPVQIRPVDLYVSKGYRQPGIVLVGDAFGTSCPAAGTGAGKALVDVERLCNVYIPRWLGTPSMDTRKISAFYDDPIKQAYDAVCLKKAIWLRTLSTKTGLHWTAARWGKFALQNLRGGARQIQRRITSGSLPQVG